MKNTRNNREASVFPKLQPFFPQEGMASVTVVEDRDRHPKAWITGDLIISLGEQEVARGPITGYYTVVMEGYSWQGQPRWFLPRQHAGTCRSLR